MTEQLKYRVFTVTRRGLSRDLPPGFESLMWVANSATLIYGERGAVLVDTFLTIEHGAELVDRVAAAGKRLTHIYITHGHGDHFSGINALKRRFPGVRCGEARTRRSPLAIAPAARRLAHAAQTPWVSGGSASS